MTGDQISRTWKEWIESPIGQQCMEESASGNYLKNRLERAFQAGVAAAERYQPLSAGGDTG